MIEAHTQINVNAPSYDPFATHSHLNFNAVPFQHPRTNVNCRSEGIPVFNQVYLQRVDEFRPRVFFKENCVNFVNTDEK